MVYDLLSAGYNLGYHYRGYSCHWHHQLPQPPPTKLILGEECTLGVFFHRRLLPKFLYELFPHVI